MATYLGQNLLRQWPMTNVEFSWWSHQMETFCRVSGHLCGEFIVHRWIPAQRPVTWSFGVFFDLSLNKRLSKQSWGWLFKTPSRPLWRHCNVISEVLWYSPASNFTHERPMYVNLTHCGLKTAYDDINFGQHWPRQWHAALRHQSVTSHYSGVLRHLPENNFTRSDHKFKP